MVDWDNASGITDSYAYELAFLIGLLPQTVNFYTAYNIRQWRYYNRLRRHGLWHGLWLWGCPSLCLFRLLFFPALFEFLFKILAAEKRIEFLVPELLLADSVIKIDAP